MKKLEILFLKVFRKDELVLSRLSDEEVLRQYRLHQDPEFIGELYTRYTHLVYGNCLHYLDDAEQARDAVMQIFEGLFDSLTKTEVRNFSSWLFQVSRNHCLMELRKRKTRKRAQIQLRLDEDVEFMESAEEVHLNTEDEMFSRETLVKALEALNPDQRKCLELMYLENNSYQQIVEITGIEWKQVKSHIQNGKRNLRKVLGPILVFLLIIMIMHL